MAETIDLDARDFAARVIRRLRVSKPDPRSRARQPEPLWVRVKHATGHGRTYSIAWCRECGFEPGRRGRRAKRSEG